MQIWRMCLLFGCFMTPVILRDGQMDAPCTNGGYGRIMLQGVEVYTYVQWNEIHLLYMQFVEHSSGDVKSSIFNIESIINLIIGMSYKVMGLVYVFIIDQMSEWMARDRYNISSAIMKVFSVHHMVSIIQHVTVVNPDAGVMQRLAKLELQQQARDPLKAAPKTKKGAKQQHQKVEMTSIGRKGTCHQFNNQGKCTHVKCKYDHVCEKCGSAEHGSFACDE